MRGQAHRTLLALALLTPLVAPAADTLTTPRPPGLGQIERRVRVDPTQPPWRDVLRLQIPDVSRCTAVLIGPRLAATAAHCLYGKRVGHFLLANSVHLLAGYASGEFTRHVTALWYRVSPGYDPARAQQTVGDDCAIVALDDTTGDTSDGLPLATGDPVLGSPLALAGYSQDRREVMLVDPDCQSMAFTRDAAGHPLLVHDCSGTRGTSGGPLLGRGPDGIWRIEGIQVAAFPGRGGLAVPVACVAGLVAGR